jgi:putative ABC transport system permease protein
MVLIGIVGGAGGPVAGIGALVVFIGIALLSPKVVPGLTGALGVLVTWRGVTGLIARENSRRQPGRTAVTSAALMVGLALVTFVSVLAAGTKATIDSAVDASFAGNLIVEGVSANGNGIPASLAVRLEKVPGVAVVAPVSFALADVKTVSGVQAVSGVDPVPFYDLRHLSFENGTVAAWDGLSNDQAALTKSFARSHHLSVGSTLSLLTASGRTVHLRDFVGFAKGARHAPVQRAVNRLLATEFPQAEALTEAKFRQQQAGEVNPLLGLVYVLLALSVVVSLFGLLNTLALAVHERKRELGLLRAVGASRSQVRQMVRYESVITSLIGAVIGLAVGLLFAVTLARPLVGPAFVFAIPVVTLIVLVFLAGIAGVLAAVFPARRAARLDILAAIAME